MWSFDTTDKYENEYAGLSSDLQKMVDDALANLSSAEYPQRLGQFKKSFRVFAYRVSDNCRIIYNVKYDNKIIELIRVGDHKAVYGKD